MSIDRLANAYQQQPTTTAERDSTGEAARAKPLQKAPAAPETAKGADPTIAADTISISPEAAYRFAAQNFDPRRITPREIFGLADMLHDNRAISSRDHSILVSGVSERGGMSAAEPEQRDLIRTFQQRLSVDMTRNDLKGVEASSRALNILGRLEALRAESA